ncbi:MAG: hypothetical protein HUJ26_14300 [Planctomycetaceae bacterium]|nr:hypothetical protein [Planctomycetaceae bacterium]
MGSILANTKGNTGSPPLAATNQKPLTERQQRVYDYLIEFTLEHGFQPSVREMMAALEIESPNGIVCHLRALHKKGWIRRSDDQQSRALHIPEIIERLQGGE